MAAPGLLVALRFLAAHLALPLLGAAAAFHPEVRRGPLALRVGVAFLAGALALTLEAMLWSLLGVRWSVTSLALPVTGLTLALAWRWGRRPAEEWAAAPRSRSVAAAGLLVTAGGLAQLAVAAATSRATASDLLLFWGVKALHWASSGGLHPAELSGPFAIHTHTTYPPLYPVVLAWSTLVAGDLPWYTVPIMTLLWVGVAAVLVAHLLARRLRGDHALAVTAFWSVAVCAALGASCSAGNAEAPLLLFEAVALAAVLGERKGDAAKGRFLAALALAGAVLTKTEGAVGAGLLVAGVAARDGWWARRLAWAPVARLAFAPAAAALAWLLVRLALGLPLSDPIREPALAVSFAHLGAILAAAPASLAAGTRGLAWLAPAALLLLLGRRRLPDLLPALALCGGLLAFLAVYYLHAVGDPTRLIGWTLPRVSIPALSALILAAGVASSVDHAERVAGEKARLDGVEDDATLHVLGHR
jgi:hypothetical protein